MFLSECEYCKFKVSQVQMKSPVEEKCLVAIEARLVAGDKPTIKNVMNILREFWQQEKIVPFNLEGKIINTLTTKFPLVR